MSIQLVQLRQMWHRSRQKIANLFCRGIVTKIDDTHKTQTIDAKLRIGEVRSDIEHPQEYGFTSKAWL